MLNQRVLEYAVKAAMALNLNIAEHSKFDRKQYFYPDLPKNYQISQYDEPIAEEGWIEVEVAEKGKDTYLKTIGIERLHMEEDAGKLVHAGMTGWPVQPIPWWITTGPVCSLRS